MKSLFTLAVILTAFMNFFALHQSFGQTYHSLSGGALTQNWSNTSLITVSDNWSMVPSIIGYRGDDITAITGVDPQTLLGEGTITIDVNANQSAPNTYTTGGVTEFEIADPVVALQGSGTADAPNIIVFLNTLGVTNIQIQYKLRDIDGSTDNAVQPVALQYRVGTTGSFTNISAGFVADASTGPSLATLVTPVSVTLPSAAENQSQVQIRIITSNASGNDEWIGIDDISISGTSGSVPPVKLAVTSINGGNSPITGTPFNVVVQSWDATNMPANVTSNTSFSLTKATGTGTLGGTLTGTILAGSNSATVIGVTYDIAESGVSITATVTSGDPLSMGTSNAFTVLPAVSAYRSSASGNWNNSSTWEAYTGTSWIPAYDFPTSPVKDVTIRNGHAVTVPTGYNLGTANNLTVENGATLYANSSTGFCFVYIHGNILNDGTIGGATDGIGFDIEGTSCQLSGTGTFNVSRIAKFTTTNAVTNFSINQDVSLSFTSASSAALRNATTTTTFNITLETGKKLTVPNAKIDLAYCTLTLKDNASLIDNGTISGMTINVTVERFLTKYNNIGDDMYHFLSSPVAAQAIQPGFVSLPNNTDDFYYWDETSNLWINSKDNSGAWNSSFESNFLIGKGYLVAYPSDITKSFTGALNTGTLNSGSGLPAVTYTSGMGDGWNLLGNPYPSSIDWDNVTSQLTNIDDAVYVYDNATSTYKSYIAGIGSLTDGIIPPAQGFFIHANNVGAPVFYLENQDRVHSSVSFYKNEPVQNVVRLKVEGNGKTDETFIRFTDNSTSGFDKQWDAYKLRGGNSVPTFCTMSENTKLSVNSLPLNSLESFVPVSVEPVTQGIYTINLTENSLSSDTYITIEDLKTGSMQRLNDNPVYTYEAATNDDPERFRIHFKNATSIGDPAANVDFFTSVLYGQLSAFSSVDGIITLSDLAGRIIAFGKVSKGNTVKFNLEGQNGIFIVTLSSQTGNKTNKVIVK